MDNKTYIFGLSVDEPVVTNDQGGKQSQTPYGFHLLPASAIFDAAKVCKEGADKYGETFKDRNYTKIDEMEHLNHALQHIYAFIAGDTQDDHLGHALVRLMFAYDTNDRLTRVFPPSTTYAVLDGMSSTSSVSKPSDHERVTLT